MTLVKHNIRYFFILTICCSVAVKSEYCYMEDANSYPYFSTKTRYDIVRAEKMLVPSGCNPSYIWALIRHGTRFIGSGKWHLDILLRLKSQIIENHELQRGMLCNMDLEALKKWDGNQYPNSMDGDLTLQGKKDALNLAKRLKTTFPDFLRASKEKYDLKTSSKLRARKTAISFANEFFQNSFTSLEENKIFVDDDILRIHDKINFIGVEKPYDAFIQSTYMQQLLSNVSMRLGFQKNLSFDEVETMYTFCAMEIAWTLKEKSPFCVAFTTDQLKMLEYLMDLKVYNELGYGFPPIKPFYCPVVHDLISKLSNAAADSTMSKLGSFYFTHSETIVPTLTKLGLYHDKEPLTPDTYETLKENRLWKTSLFDPFLSNLIVVLYKCAAEHKVAVYNNENIIHFPGCNEKLCSFTTFKRNLNDKLDPKKCAVESKYLKDAPVQTTSRNESKFVSSYANQQYCWIFTFLNSLFSYTMSAFFNPLKSFISIWF